MRTPLPGLGSVVLLALLWAGTSLADGDGGGWEPQNAAEGPGFSYRVFAKQGEEFVLYQARGRIEAPPEKLIQAVRAVVADPARAPAGQTRRLVSQDEHAFTVYTHIDLPAFFSDRDIVTRGVGVVEPETGRRRIDWKAIEHEEVPPIEGTIRIRRSAGFWDFQPEGDGASTAVYETYVDMGGSLPGWLVGPMMGGMVGDAFEDVAAEALGR